MDSQITSFDLFTQSIEKSNMRVNNKNVIYYVITYKIKIIIQKLVLKTKM